MMQTAADADQSPARGENDLNALSDEPKTGSAA
jgi:hypothetical protein